MALLEGIAQFNRREFFACHETLEALWLAERRPVRQLYQGILQVGVGFYHQSRGNSRGTMYSLDQGLARLRPFTPVCHQVDVARLVDDSERAAEALRKLGPAGIQDFATDLVPTISLAV